MEIVNNYRDVFSLFERSCVKYFDNKVVTKTEQRLKPKNVIVNNTRTKVCFKNNLSAQPFCG